MQDDQAIKDFFELISGHVTDSIIAHDFEFGELTVEVAVADLVSFIEDIKRDNTTAMTTLIDITAIDYPQEQKRFRVVYHFLSMTRNQRMRIVVKVGEDETLPSINSVHPSANWYEREVFDMFGIPFAGHPDMRRILTDYGFEGHPLRKDFPTTGYVELRYDELEKRVVYEPVSLVQDYRQFDFLSPWEGAKYVLPGDEKGGN